MVRASDGGLGGPPKHRPQQLNPIGPEVRGAGGLRPDGNRAGGLEEQPPAPHGDVLGAQALTIVNLMTVIPRRACGFSGLLSGWPPTAFTAYGLQRGTGAAATA